MKSWLRKFYGHHHEMTVIFQILKRYVLVVKTRIPSFSMNVTSIICSLYIITTIEATCAERVSTLPEHLISLGVFVLLCMIFIFTCHGFFFKYLLRLKRSYCPISKFQFKRNYIFVQSCRCLLYCLVLIHTSV